MEKKKYNRKIRHWISYPFIWVIIFPVFILDIFLEIYHHICFPLFGIPKVKRSNYIRVDRHKLKYLSRTERIGCIYCGYVNGFLGYAIRISGNTEKYWCGIKHKTSDNFVSPPHHKDFMEYGDEGLYKERDN